MAVAEDTGFKTALILSEKGYRKKSLTVQDIPIRNLQARGESMAGEA